MKKLIKAFVLIFLFFQIGVVFGLSNLPIASSVFAWEGSQSAESICWLNPSDNVNYVHIKVSYTNNEDKAIKVKAHDNNGGQEVDLGTINSHETKTGEIRTGQHPNIVANSVTFFLTWADGAAGSETKTVNYSSLECPQPAAPTPTPTTPVATPIPTIVPTAIPTPTNVPAINVQANATATNNVTVQQVQQVQQTQQAQAAPKPQVLAAVKMTELPKTGAQDNILLGLFSLIPAGIFIKKKAESMLQR